MRQGVKGSVLPSWNSHASRIQRRHRAKVFRRRGRQAMALPRQEEERMPSGGAGKNASEHRGTEDGARNHGKWSSSDI
jgi:hypothetical protein